MELWALILIVMATLDGPASTVVVPGYKDLRACQGAGEYAISDVRTFRMKDKSSYLPRVADGYACIPGPR